MAARNRTQKQVAEKYKGNLDYFHKGHYLRRLRLLAFLLVVAGSLAAVFTYRYWGRDEIFNTGPISKGHARFAHDCKACHEAAETDPLMLLPLDKAHTLTDERLKQIAGGITVERVKGKAAELGEHARGINAERLRELADKGLALTDLTRMDQACIKCHEPMQLHAPQAVSLGLRSVSRELPLVHAGSCSSCHREHEGPGPMKLPGSESCADCHNHADRLERALQLIKFNIPDAPVRAENRDFGDGVRRFIVPHPDGEPPAVFAHYADGHPPFDYERREARDPGTLSYNHQRHEQPDIPMLDGRKMDCVDCHQPGVKGEFYQPVTYAKHCQRCHSLHIDPDVPDVTIPHGDPEKVRSFLRSLVLQYSDNFVRERGISDKYQLGLYIKGQFEKLKRRGIADGDELERRVFFTGDPPRETQRLTPRSNTGFFFPACAKCHEVTEGEPGRPPKIEPVNIAERWIQRGPFTHEPHQHMSCIDCHGAAHTSTSTSDILLPPQKLCAECHRPLDKEKVVELAAGVALTPGSSELAARQRREGGVKEDCQSCHRFHAPAEATALAREHGFTGGAEKARAQPAKP